MKILLTNSNCSWNKGSAAQVIATASIIRNQNPQAEITLVSHFPGLDSKFCECHGIKVINHGILNNLIFKIVFYLASSVLLKIGLKRFLSKNSLINEYNDSDVIVDLSGDTFSDVGAFSFDVISSLIFAYSFKKPLIIYSQSIGPFRKISVPFAKYIIEKADNVVVREEITSKYLEDMGVKSPLYVIPDCAFVLEPSNEYRVNKIFSDEKIIISKPLVGISVNGMVGDTNYISVMGRVVDYLTISLGVQVIFVPHVVARSEEYIDDDRLIGTKIYNLLENKEDVNLINGDYSPNDLKGIIKLCDMFIGGRMHANIAALSTNVPTIATSWSHKYHGIMESLGLGYFVCNITNIDFEEIKLKIDKLWETRSKVKFNLENKTKAQMITVWESGKYITDLFEN